MSDFSNIEKALDKNLIAEKASKEIVKQLFKSKEDIEYLSIKHREVASKIPCLNKQKSDYYHTYAVTQFLQNIFDGIKNNTIEIVVKE